MRRPLLRRVLGILAIAAALAARGDDPSRRGFDPDPPRPALGHGSAFTTEGATVGSPGSYRLGLELDVVHGLLSLRDGGKRIGWVIPDRTALHLLGSYTLGRFELGAGLPVALHQADGLSALRALGVSGPLVAPVAAAGLGDLRLLAKTQLLSEDGSGWPVSLASSLELRLPTGAEKAFLSDGWTAIPAVEVGRRLGRLRLGGSAGYKLRQPGQFLQLVVHDGLVLGAAASYDLPHVGPLSEWRALVDLAAELPRAVASTGSRYRAPASVRAGLRARVSQSLWADLGVGTGLAGAGEGGFGRESWRIFAGLGWQHLAHPGGAAPPPAPVPVPVPFPGRPDRDGDGVPDDIDRCPDQPGPANLEGCPDADGDGIPDIDDKCPNEPGPVQNDGCPVPEEEPLVEIETSRLSLRDMIHFDTDRDTIKPESNKILDEIAAILKSHSELKRVRVEGHTDNTGSRPYNLGLSQRRAASVVRALVARGVPAALLEAQGYGFDKPVASNATAVGRARNRRVEFTIVDGEAAPEGPPR